MSGLASGVSCFFGLAVSCIGLPLNHFVGKVVVGAQDNLMKARDERVALMNEVIYIFFTFDDVEADSCYLQILGGIRMIKVCVPATSVILNIRLIGW